MPLLDTMQQAQIAALRSRPSRPMTKALQEKAEGVSRTLSQLEQGIYDVPRGYREMATHPLESLTGMAESVRHPIQTAKLFKSALQNEESRNRMIGSMLVPDPLKLIKGLRARKALNPTVSNIVVPETLALPEERTAIELAKRGAPDYETGWFKGPDGLLRKELQPVEWDLKSLEWGHPDLEKRLTEHGAHMSPPIVQSGMRTDQVVKGVVAAYDPHENTISLGHTVEKLAPEHQKELLTHELQHAIQTSGLLGPGFTGSSPGRGVTMRKYLLNPGEIEARAAGARDYLLDPRYRELVPFDWNTKKMAERLRWGGTTPKMEGPAEFLQDMEDWLMIAEPPK